MNKTNNINIKGTSSPAIKKDKRERRISELFKHQSTSHIFEFECLHVEII